MQKAANKSAAASVNAGVKLGSESSFRRSALGGWKYDSDTNFFTVVAPAKAGAQRLSFTRSITTLDSGPGFRRGRLLKPAE